MSDNPVNSNFYPKEYKMTDPSSFYWPIFGCVFGLALLIMFCRLCARLHTQMVPEANSINSNVASNYYPRQSEPGRPANRSIPSTAPEMFPSASNFPYPRQVTVPAVHSVRADEELPPSYEDINKDFPETSSLLRNVQGVPTDSYGPPREAPPPYSP